MTQKNVDPDTIKVHGRDVSEYVEKRLDKVAKTLNADGVFDLEGGDFSQAMVGMAMAHPIAVQFVSENIEAQVKEAAEMAGKLTQAAVNYSKAEEQNTAR